MPKQKRGAISFTRAFYDRIQDAAKARGIKGSTLVEMACADPNSPRVVPVTADNARDEVWDRYPTAICREQETRSKAVRVFFVTRGKPQSNEVPLGSGSGPTRCEAWKAAARALKAAS